MSPAKHPHTITPPPPCFTVGNTHAKTRDLEPKNLQFGLQTKGQISTGLMSIARVSWPKQVSFLLVSFSSGFFAAIWPRRPDSHSLNSWCWDVCYLNSVKHLFGLQFLRLLTLISQSIKCIYKALFLSANVTKCFTETQPKIPNSKHCRSMVARKNSLEKGQNLGKSGAYQFFVVVPDTSPFD